MQFKVTFTARTQTARSTNCDESVQTEIVALDGKLAKVIRCLFNKNQSKILLPVLRDSKIFTTTQHFLNMFSENRYIRF